ncbi:short chain dehydrogenase [Komagataeibacter rhaeticus]|uniref:SDR family oxidoreductase n=1 Tax=Komagataeibacter rhaeticus TaxID=215221 RepID=UPI0004D87692|nr:SDR family oxidoreductase [Komagataeibacter rhaeticus]KDU95847.1 short-chain dehydrogenase [Komagataeibacter rhaeticus AF1]MBL7240138.1 SDR family oxidoreductase [Komagataeibacter rhaeticus]PYD54711.1 short chain dehydrogenase [Komagataeibacter rhaeticus]GBQ16248.1 short chain dehydrogenase [Komagataeibacter rhaeticus DSM 16663]
MNTPMAWPVPQDVPRVALVTGGAARLGRAIALELARAGFDVALHCNRSVQAAGETMAEIRALGRGSCVLQADLACEASVRPLLADATRALGPVGVLVNNASLFRRDEWDSATREGWDAHMEPNTRAPFVLMQEFARLLPAHAAGMVLNMLDERVWSLTPHFVSYTVSKAALWTLTQTMALALAPCNIRVNAIGPGPVLPTPAQSAGQFARQCASVPLGRAATPDEIARAALSLLCLPSVTGQMLALDGGQHMQWSPAPARG